MQNENFFSIAELDIKICFAESPFNGMHLIPSLEPFREKNLKGELFFQLSVDDTLSPYPKEKRKRIRAFDTGNGNTIVDKLDNGGYQYIIKDIQGANCCLLLTNKDFSDCQCALNGNYNMRKFGLNNALMLIFAFAGSKIETLLLLERKDTMLSQRKSKTRCHHPHRPRTKARCGKAITSRSLCIHTAILFFYEMGSGYFQQYLQYHQPSC